MAAVRMSPWRQLLFAVVAVAAVVMSGCLSTSKSGSSATASGDEDVPNGCVAVDVASSPEKLDLLTTLAASFNKSKAAKVAGTCGYVRVEKVSSGAGEQWLADGWQSSDTDLPKPVIWTPAASAWGGVLNDSIASQGQPAIAPANPKSFMRTP